MELDIKEFKIQDSIKCECGHEFSLKDITDLRTINEHGFYANIVKHCSYTKCPNCYKETLLLLRQKGQTWEILNTAVPKVEVEMEQENIKNNINAEGTTSQNNEEKENTQEFICPECKKVCKNQLGLNAHMRTHQN